MDRDNIVEFKTPSDEPARAAEPPNPLWERAISLENEVYRLRLVIAAQAIRLVEMEEAATG